MKYVVPGVAKMNEGTWMRSVRLDVKCGPEGGISVKWRPSGPVLQQFARYQPMPRVVM